jgi:hypothetical protein
MFIEYWAESRQPLRSQTDIALQNFRLGCVNALRLKHGSVRTENGCAGWIKEAGDSEVSRPKNLCVLSVFARNLF